MSSSYSSRLSRVAKEGEDREASSGIVSACHAVSRCYVVLGLSLITLGASASWWLFEISRRLRLIDEYTRLHSGAANLPSSSAPGRLANYGVACGVIAILNAGILFRSSSGLRAFSRTRKVADLFPAVSRVRTMWFVFSLSVLAVIGIRIYAHFSGMFSLQEPEPQG